MTMKVAAFLLGVAISTLSSTAHAGGNIAVGLPGLTGASGSLTWDQIGDSVRILSATNTSSVTVKDLHLTFQFASGPSFTRGIVLNPGIGPGDSFNGILNPPPLWFTNVGYGTVSVIKAEWSTTGTVPEPETYALALTGLAIAVLATRRKA